jgi:GTP cyclohydrolase II
MIDRPIVIVNVAVTPSGSMDGPPGSTISCRADLARVHQAREQVAAIAVGARTWAVDRPRLDVRAEHLGRQPVRHPARIVFAGSSPLDVGDDPRRPTIVVADDPTRHHLSTAVTAIPSRGRSLREILAILHRLGISSLLVEGGATLLRSFFAQGLVDLATAYVATGTPRLAFDAAHEVVGSFGSRAEIGPLGEGTLVTFRTGGTSVDFGASMEARCPLPTRYGDFDARVFGFGRVEHVALSMGDLSGSPPLVRVHSSCWTGDVSASLRCDCGPQLHKALRLIAREKRGVLVYLAQEGRGIGLIEKIRAYTLQDQGLDTIDANLALGHPVDGRDYSAAALILGRLGLSSVRLLSNNPEKATALEQYGIEVVERRPLATRPNPNNARYLATKRTRLSHVGLIETAMTAVSHAAT